MSGELHWGDKSQVWSYKSQAIQIAKELCYDEKYISQIKEANTTAKISQILATARKAKFG